MRAVSDQKCRRKQTNNFSGYSVTRKEAILRMFLWTFHPSDQQSIKYLTYFPRWLGLNKCAASSRAQLYTQLLMMLSIYWHRFLTACFAMQRWATHVPQGSLPQANGSPLKKASSMQRSPIWTKKTWRVEDFTVAIKQGVQCVSQQKDESHRKLWFARILPCFHQMAFFLRLKNTHDMRKTPIVSGSIVKPQRGLQGWWWIFLHTDGRNPAPVNR